MILRTFKSKIAFGILCVVLSVAAVSLTDVQSDEQNQRTIKFFGSNSVEALTEPDNLICVLSQLWKSEFVGQGNVHVKVNEKKCFGTGEGDEEITAIVNLSIDPITGDTIGKVWYDDQNSIAFNNNHGIVYIKGVVSSAPSPTEPYGRFDISVVEQLNNDLTYTVDGDRLSTMRIIALGNVFKFVGQSREITSTRPASPAYDPFNTFSSFSDRNSKRAAYNNNGTNTVISYDNSEICFETGSTTDCYSTDDNTATQIVGSYGLYDTAGKKVLTQVITPNQLLIGGTSYLMPYGFGGPIITSLNSSASTGPGLVSSSTSALLNGSPIKVAWLARFLQYNIQGTYSLTMDADTSLLLDPNGAGVLIDIRSEIGPLPQAALNLPVRARAGKIL
jgi:hypothetical protein